jgi:hypothetical protein
MVNGLVAGISIPEFSRLSRLRSYRPARGHSTNGPVRSKPSKPLASLGLKLRLHVVSLHVQYINRARICKRFTSPGIDSKEPIPPAYVAWADQYVKYGCRAGLPGWESIPVGS